MVRERASLLSGSPRFYLFHEIENSGLIHIAALYGRIRMFECLQETLLHDLVEENKLHIEAWNELTESLNIATNDVNDLISNKMKTLTWRRVDALTAEAETAAEKKAAAQREAEESSEEDPWDPSEESEEAAAAAIQTKPVTNTDTTLEGQELPIFTKRDEINATFVLDYPVYGNVKAFKKDATTETQRFAKPFVIKEVPENLRKLWDAEPLNSFLCEFHRLIKADDPHSSGHRGPARIA